MRYQVPQFIEVEDKIFGPLTFKQFVYVVGGAGMGFVFFKFLPIFIGIPVALAAVAFGLALAFYKVNNKPFIEVVEAAFKYSTNNKLYIWRKADKKPEANTEAKIASDVAASFTLPKLSDSKLKDLTWSLDINETIYSKEAGKLSTREGMQIKNGV